VEIITAGRRDPPALQPIINDIFLKHIAMLKEVSAYEYNDRFLHMKIFQFDKKITTVGSFNADKLSWNINHELNVVIHGGEDVKKVREMIEYIKKNAVKIRNNQKIPISRALKARFWENWMDFGHFIATSDWEFSTETMLMFGQNRANRQEWAYKLKKERMEREMNKPSPWNLPNNTTTENSQNS
jgi:phosphatidylserine/phosphatidylglycerophosphate/cardiolipin synthase-like enzyme